MKPAKVFAVLIAPAIAWLAMGTWVTSNLPEWAESSAKLGLFVRLIISAHNWSIRLAPFAMFAFFVVSPLLAVGLALAAASGAESPDAEGKALLAWWCTALASMVAGAMASTAEHNLYLLVATAWASFVSYSIALGSAFRLQRARVRRGSSAVNAGWVLGGAGLLVYLLPVAFLVPPVVWALARRDAERGPA